MSAPSTIMIAPPDYCETVDETIAATSKDEMPPIYVMDVNNLTWQRAFPPTYDDEERQLDRPLRSIEAEIDSEHTRMYKCGPCMLSETKSFLLCFFSVFVEYFQRNPEPKDILTLRHFGSSRLANEVDEWQPQIVAIAIA
ncbi:hypothetical protein L5515_006179 [Caenorhabditis briggsae]|uniref:Uncharacterized protein n=1 Tax=Caenorhabditis briggsae TaxID=6238 RepID=A0AAE9F059_CAEBR|nr:hypothetical protein L5515_006179 [Caenorhabditis briggsae]